VAVKERRTGTLVNRHHFSPCASNPPGQMSGRADLLLDNLERVTAPHQIPGKVVEADAKIAAPEAVQDAASGKNRSSMEAPFWPQAALWMIMRTSRDRLLR
jgi:hypothetical protein